MQTRERQLCQEADALQQRIDELSNDKLGLETALKEVGACCLSCSEPLGTGGGSARPFNPKCFWLAWAVKSLQLVTFDVRSLAGHLLPTVVMTARVDVPGCRRMSARTSWRRRWKRRHSTSPRWKVGSLR